MDSLLVTTPTMAELPKVQPAKRYLAWVCLGWCCHQPTEAVHLLVKRATKAEKTSKGEDVACKSPTQFGTIGE